MVHGRGDGGDGMQTVHSQVGALLHHPYHRREPVELTGFRGSQRVLSEERQDAARQVAETTHPIPGDVVAVVVAQAIDADDAAAEEAPQVLEDRHATNALNHRELRLDLPAETTRSIPEDRNAEAPLAVDEADDP